MKEAGDQPDWFVVGPDQRPYGPYTLGKLVAYIDAGALQPRQLICKRGMSAWVEARSVDQLHARFEAVSSPRASRDRRSAAPAHSEEAGPADSRMPKLTPAWVAERAVSRTRTSLPVDVMMAIDDMSSYAIVAGGVLAIIATTVLLGIETANREGHWAIAQIALAILGLGLSQYAGLRMSAVCGKVIARSTVVISNSAILDIFGAAAILVLVTVIVVSGIAAYETKSFGLLILAALFAPLPLVAALFAFNPQILGVRVSEDGSLGEDSIALLGLPTRAFMASAGIVTAIASILGGCGSMIAVAAIVFPHTVDPGFLWGGLSPSQAAWAAIGYVALAGLWPTVTYIWSATEHLFLGTIEAIHAVGRQARKSGEPTERSDKHE